MEKYLKKCLESVFNQTYRDYEVIVVNDGTKDNSMKIVDKYDVTTIYQENQGLSAARNTGVRYAKGEYLLFLDSDDYIDKYLLEKINDSLDNNPDIVRFQIREIYESTSDKKDFKEEAFTNKNGVEAFKRICNYNQTKM